MNSLFKEGISVLLAALGRLASPFLATQLSRLSLLIVSDVPRIEKAWTASFREPTAEGSVRAGAVDVILKQFGNRVWGTGTIHGEPADPFEFNGRVKWNVFYGTFHRRDSRILAGTGTFEMKIAADARSMRGYCNWFDGLIDQAWASEYAWSFKG